MKGLERVCLASLSILLCVSCTNSTEKYAQKEHGKKFDSWELSYQAKDYDVYWPTLKLVDQSEGTLTEVKSDFDWWSGRLLKRDTTQVGALLYATITNIKSRNDAKYYNSIRFQVSNLDKRYRSNLEHRFTFNEGQRDSLSFSAKSNDNHLFIPSREDSEKIISMLCKKESTDMKVVFRGNSVEGEYSFTIKGSPKLSKGLELNHERKLFAEKEFKKADGKAEKELEELFK